MMKRLLTRVRRGSGDRGSVLVSAVAVAVIGLGLTVVVLTQAISVTQSAGRDRIRTAEVHSAESAIDAMMSELSTSSPCPGPAWSPLTVGSGTSATVVTVTIAYSANGNPLTCTNGSLGGVPDRAVVTAVSEPAVAGSGVAPKRTFEAAADLEPQQSTVPGDAIFTSGALSIGRGLVLTPEDATKPAGIWVDSGNYICNESNNITGSIFVVTGYVEMSNSSCRVDGDVWVKGNYITHSAVTSGWQVTGDLTIQSGKLDIRNPTRIGGDVMVGGNVSVNNTTSNILNTNQWKNSVWGSSICAANIGNPCGTIESKAKRNLPVVDYTLADWQPTEDGLNFQVKYKEDFGEAMIQSFGLANLAPNDWGNLWKPAQIRANPCQMPGSYISTQPIILPAPGVTTPTIYDMRDCGTTGTQKIKVDGQGMNVKLYADVAIFANSIEGASSFNVTSGDGASHRLWFIVPWGAGAEGRTAKNVTIGTRTFSYDPGDLIFRDNGLNNSDGKIDIFMYTPEKAWLPSFSVFHGQIYARDVEINAGANITYSGIGVPGVNLSTTSSSSNGFSVALASKRELSN